MNLTKWFVVGLCLTAMTVSATILQSDAFESAPYSSSWSGVNPGLQFGLSVVLASDASQASYTNSRPMIGVTSNYVLRLNTDGFIITNTVNRSFRDSPVYVDMLVKFVPSVELPSLDPSVKLAVAVTNGYLFITKKGVEWNQTDQQIVATDWYRFSAVFKAVTTSNWVVDPFLEGGGGWQVDTRKRAIVKINGRTIKVGGEEDFVVADYVGTSFLKSIGFSGMGFIDEVVVRDDDVFGEGKFAGIYPVIDYSKYTEWLAANHIVQGREMEEMYTAFLWNVPPDGTFSPNLKIGSINVGANIVLTLVADYVSPAAVVPINTANLNNGAVVTVWGKVSLSDPSWHNFGPSLTFDPVVGVSTNQFFKADISIP